jgi:hypothetical protein
MDVSRSLVIVPKELKLELLNLILIQTLNLI